MDASFLTNGLPIYPPENDEPNEKNTIVFKLHVRCEKGGPRIKGACYLQFCFSVYYTNFLDSLLLCNFAYCVYAGTVKSDELKWLPNGSEFVLSTGKSTSDSTEKTKTYTSFSCSQDSFPEFLKNPIAPKHDDIILAKLGPGQVCLLVFREEPILHFHSFFRIVTDELLAIDQPLFYIYKSMKAYTKILKLLGN